ncbi:hypothetical protein [Cerasicoccus frondis]|uniref:hypothetical protein n=1 Tax=Cerasicoccus frondis TaxID=490090 RepID=UPI0028525AFE|nr:hypothetical protein [Cerasicoccus frondis]
MTLSILKAKGIAYNALLLSLGLYAYASESGGIIVPPSDTTTFSTVTDEYYADYELESIDIEILNPSYYLIVSEHADDSTKQYARSGTFAFNSFGYLAANNFALYGYYIDPDGVTTSESSAINLKTALDAQVEVTTEASLEIQLPSEQEVSNPLPLSWIFDETESGSEITSDSVFRFENDQLKLYVFYEGITFAKTFNFSSEARSLASWQDLLDGIQINLTIRTYAGRGRYTTVVYDTLTLSAYATDLNALTLAFSETNSISVKSNSVLGEWGVFNNTTTSSVTEIFEEPQYVASCQIVDEDGRAQSLEIGLTKIPDESDLWMLCLLDEDAKFILGGNLDESGNPIETGAIFAYFNADGSLNGFYTNRDVLSSNGSLNTNYIIDLVDTDAGVATSNLSVQYGSYTISLDFGTDTMSSPNNVGDDLLGGLSQTSSITAPTVVSANVNGYGPCNLSEIGIDENDYLYATYSDGTTVSLYKFVVAYLDLISDDIVEYPATSDMFEYSQYQFVTHLSTQALISMLDNANDTDNVPPGLFD